MIYFAQAKKNGLVKIGCSTKPFERIKYIYVEGIRKKLRMLKIIKGDFDTERQIHRILNRSQAWSEWFFPTKEVISFIENQEGITYNRIKIPIPDKEIDEFLENIFENSYIPYKYRDKKIRVKPTFLEN